MTLFLVALALASPLSAQTSKVVREAMEAVRRGDSSRMASLQRLGDRALPEIARYVRDRNDDVRREAVTLLGLSGSPRAIAPVAGALLDSSADIRQRAARLLYEHFEPARVAASGPAVRDLQRATCTDPLAGAMLLLAYAPGPDSRRCLEFARRLPGSPMVKPRDDSLPVPASLPALVALSRLGDNPARHELIETIAKGDLAVLRFVLLALREVDAPEVLHALKPYLRDQREITGGVPSGVVPARRLCDETADALVRRLDLKVDFAVTGDGRYTDAQLEQVRRRMDEFLPQADAHRPSFPATAVI